MSICKACNEYFFVGNHCCKPEYYCFRSYNDLVDSVKFGGISIRARNEEEAAIRYCEKYSMEISAPLEVLVVHKAFFNINDVKISTIDNVSRIIYSKCKKFYIESESIISFFVKREIK